jgi:hypothetical protein
VADKKTIPEVREAIDAEDHPVLKEDAHHEDAKLDIELDESFPTSDAPSQTRPGGGEPAVSSGFDEEAERRIQEERVAPSAGVTLTARFRTRRLADVAVEHLVQEQGIERTDIFVVAEGSEASSGEEADAADVESGHPGSEPGGDPALGGAILVSVDLADADREDEVAAILKDLDADTAEAT